MAEPCEIPDEPRPLWREVLAGSAELVVFLLVIATIVAGLVFLAPR